MKMGEKNCFQILIILIYYVKKQLDNSYEIIQFYNKIYKQFLWQHGIRLLKALKTTF